MKTMIEILSEHMEREDKRLENKLTYLDKKNFMNLHCPYCNYNALYTYNDDELPIRTIGTKNILVCPECLKGYEVCIAKYYFIDKIKQTNDIKKQKENIRQELIEWYTEEINDYKYSGDPLSGYEKKRVKELEKKLSKLKGAK